jgi:CHAT domain-containing protein
MKKLIQFSLVAFLIALACVFYPMSGLRAESASGLIEQGQKSYDVGQFATAYDVWRRAEEIYARANDQVGVLGSRVNQSQALLQMGQYRNACKTISLSLKYQELVCDPENTNNLSDKPLTHLPDLTIRGLVIMAESMRLLGNFESSQSLLINIAKDAELSPTNNSLILVGLGNTLRDIGKREGVRKGLMILESKSAKFCLEQGVGAKGDEDYYRRSIDCYQRAVKSSPFSSTFAKLNQVNLYVEVLRALENEGHASEEYRQRAANWKKDFDSPRLISEIATEIRTMPSSRSGITARINLAKILSYAHEPQWRNIESLIRQSLSDAVETNDLRSQSYALGTMGFFKEKQRDYSEAINYSRQGADIANTISAYDLAYQWEWQVAKNMGYLSPTNIQAPIPFYEKAVNALEKIRAGALSINSDAQFSLRDNVEPLYRELLDLKLQKSNIPNKELERIVELVDSLKLAEIENYLQCRLLNSESKKLIELENDVAVIYPIILNKRLEIIIRLSGNRIKRVQQILERDKLERTISSFREEIANSEQNIDRQYSKGSVLYQWLIDPIKPYISSAGVKNLIFVMDNKLRDLPVSALYDSKKNEFLLDQYSSAYVPSLSIFTARKKSSILSNGLIVGLTNDKDLLHVKSEVGQIKKYLKNSTELTGDNFTTRKFKDLISSNSYSMIHLATHGSFDSDPKKTFIKTNDGYITIGEIELLLNKQRKVKLNTIELLALSACKTAAGDQRATLGIAGAAIKSGANSTIASLWSVNDASTFELMDKFYSTLSRNSNMAKTEALATAQKFIRSKKDYQSPYYWAPFVLVGDWK